MMLVHLRQGSSAYSWYNFNLNSFVSLSRAMKYNQEKEVFRQPQMPLSWEESLAGKYLHAQWCLHNCADKSFRYFIISLFSVIISFEDSLKKQFAPAPRPSSGTLKVETGRGAKQTVNLDPFNWDEWAGLRWAGRDIAILQPQPRAVKIFCAFASNSTLVICPNIE